MLHRQRLHLRFLPEVSLRSPANSVDVMREPEPANAVCRDEPQPDKPDQLSGAWPMRLGGFARSPSPADAASPAKPRGPA